MSSWLMSVLRTGVQALVGLVVTALAAHGLNVPLEVQGAAAQTLVAIAVAAVVTVTTAALRWLESRHGDSLPARAARGLAHVLMLGLSGKQPVYVEPDQRLRVIGGDGIPRPPR